MKNINDVKLKKYYLIKINTLYYGKNNANGRIINPKYFIDEMTLYYTIKEIAYTTKQGVRKAAQKLQKEKHLQDKDIIIQCLCEAV